MTFGPDHYVPVLKTKRGEKSALRSIAASLQPRITPLLEIVERNKETLSAHLDNSFEKLAESVSSYSRCFIDARELAPDGQRGALDVFKRATDAGITFTPVTGVSRTADVSAALEYQTNGLALRLSKNDLDQGELAKKVSAFIVQYRLVPNQVDLILDLGPVEELIVEGVAAFAEAFMANVPDHQEWRTFTISACAFSKSLGKIEPSSYASIERDEWLAWRDYLYDQRRDLVRLPTFSDCAIQHPDGVEGFDPRVMAASAAIRYALEKEWLIIKGKSTKRVLPSKQFPGLAKTLVYGDCKASYLGESHCNGCQSMKNAADGGPRLGSPEAWRRMGTIHHLSVVTQTLASLPWP